MSASRPGRISSNCGQCSTSIVADIDSRTWLAVARVRGRPLDHARSI
jgi:hypothetical protein